MNDKGLPIISASIDSDEDEEDTAKFRKGTVEKPFVQLVGEGGTKLIYRQESVRKLYNNDSRRYEESMKKFEDERREYANKVHHLITKKRAQARKRGKNETQADVRLESNKLDLQPPRQ